MTGDKETGAFSALVETFLQARYSVILAAVSLCLGAWAVVMTPREEEPQIVVPMADVAVSFPGAGSREVEALVSVPLERLLWQIDGVEYVYSQSRRDGAVVTVRFHVGEDRERSLVKLHNQIARHEDQAPPGVTGWVVRPVEIDDVPMVTVTLFSDDLDDYALRRVGEEVMARLAETEDTSGISLVGGRSREVRVELDPSRMAGLGLDPLGIQRALAAADASGTAGSFSALNRETVVGSQSFLASAEQVRALVVGVHDGRPVYLRDVARVMDGPEEPGVYSRIGFSARAVRSGEGPEGSMPAVTLAVAKKKGTNAVDVARDIRERMAGLSETVLPAGVSYTVTRDFGQTADDKVHNLLINLTFAVLTVVVLLAFTLGWREAVVVALAVPVSFSLALFVNYLLGYTINRVTLFALILSLGLVVDDPITNVDNIQRHIRAGVLPPRKATVAAVSEVLPPVVMSTLAIIVSFAPLFFITGMMGPYMAPMAANVPLTVTFSTLCAVTIVPWMACSLLRSTSGRGQTRPENAVSPTVLRIYRSILDPFLGSAGRRLALFSGIGLLLGGCLLLAGLRLVPFKMLPFDNKNEFQLVLDMPEGTPLEATNRAVTRFEAFLATVPEVTEFVSYVGRPSPMDFNGLVRHYFLREGPHLADIRVNLVHRDRREAQSHDIVLRLRPGLEALARETGVDLKIVESPPGPPVLSTLVTEVYGEPETSYEDMVTAAKKLAAVMVDEPGVVDVDVSSEAERDRLDFVLDKEKAALHGVSAQDVVAVLRTALSGSTPALVHLPHERQPLLVRLTLPRALRSGPTDLAQIRLASTGGHLVPLGELGIFRILAEDQPVMRKNLRPVVYVTAETAGIAPGEAVLDLQSRLRGVDLGPGIEVDWAGEGEWKITLDVFRDLGLANAAALLGIYLLLVLQTGSVGLPMLIMLAVPLTLLGIMPGFWLLNLLFSRPVGELANPIFFTATSMIGMIALGGIVIRNSLVLVEFIQAALKRGERLREAVIQSGAIRLRPIVLTALTTALGAWPITLDPIFSGLAWALIFGLTASTAFTLVVVPTVYYVILRRRIEPEPKTILRTHCHEVDL
ncbi:MAG: efflux RND transporter permease subunit [Deltaproteobacteria bacterium]|nr:efflux RND transporter permease subunit [Deltaproteobacteria bacterium]